MKIKYLILSGVIFLVVAISGITLYSCWPAITGTINKNKYYTNQDMEANYEKGFQEGCSNFIELTGQVDYYKDLTDVYYLQILELQDTVKSLESSNKTNLETVSQLENQKQVLESEVANLETNIANNKKTISDLNSQIAVLQTQAEQVPSLNSQIANLQATSLQLQAVNNSNAATITNLNNQIISLNNQISEMSSLTQNAGSQITTLNNRINELQATVSYYESYISQLENTEQAVVTYEVDGEVWEIRIVSKGEISLPVLESTEIKTFNGWKIDGQDELFGDTYTLNTNTKFVADFTYKHAVKFMVDDQVYDNQYVVENESVIIPTAPVKVDYEFLGWSLNGVDIVENIDLLAVTQDVTYQAVFTKIHTVTFMVDDQVIATQKVSNGKCASEVEVEIEEDMVLTGWKINGVIVDVPTYVINADTLFVTEILYKDFVLEYAVYPAALGGDKIWTDGDTIYYSSGTTHCVLDTINYTVSSIEWSGLTSFSGYDIWTDGDNVYYSYNSKQYVLDMTNYTVLPMTWSGLTSFSGSDVWTDGNNVYYSDGSKHYVLDKETSTWSKKTWSGLTSFSGSDVWTDGNNIYYSSGTTHYVFDIVTNSWISKEWVGLTYFFGSYVWTDGEDYYVSNYKLVKRVVNA